MWRNVVYWPANISYYTNLHFGSPQYGGLGTHHGFRELLPTVLNVVGVHAADEDKDDPLVENITAEARAYYGLPFHQNKLMISVVSQFKRQSNKLN